MAYLHQAPGAPTLIRRAPGALGAVDFSAAAKAGTNSGAAGVTAALKKGEMPDPGAIAEAALDASVAVAAGAVCAAYGIPPVPPICSFIAGKALAVVKKLVLGPLIGAIGGLFRAKPVEHRIDVSPEAQVAMLDQWGDKSLFFEVGQLQSLHRKLGLPGPYCFQDVVDRLKAGGAELRAGSAAQSLVPEFKGQYVVGCGKISTRYLAPLFGAEFKKRIGLLPRPTEPATVRRGQTRSTAEALRTASWVADNNKRISAFYDSRAYPWSAQLRTTAVAEALRLGSLKAAMEATAIADAEAKRLVAAERKKLATAQERVAYVRCMDRIGDHDRCVRDARSAPPAQPPPTAVYGTTPLQRIYIERCAAQRPRPTATDWMRCRKDMLIAMRKPTAFPVVPVLAAVGTAAGLWALTRRR